MFAYSSPLDISKILSGAWAPSRSWLLRSCPPLQSIRPGGGASAGGHRGGATRTGAPRTSREGSRPRLREFFLFLTFFNNILSLTRIGFYLQGIARLVAPARVAR